MIRARRLCLALMGAYVLPASAIAQVTQYTPPSDNELRSAYCVSLLKLQIAFMQNGLAQMDVSAKNPTAPVQAEVQEYATKAKAETRENLAKVGAARDRLQAYLLPKLLVLEPAAVALAMKRGEADWQAFVAMTDRCSTKCSPIQPEDQAKACWS